MYNIYPMKEAPRPQQDTCFNAQGEAVNPDEANCAVKTVDGVTISAFKEACPNGMDFVTIRNAQGDMIPLFSRKLCYVEPDLYVQDGDVIFQGKNEYGIYKAPVAPAYTPTPTPAAENADTTRVLIPTNTPLPEPITQTYINTPQPLIEVQPTPPPAPNCWVALGLAALPFVLAVHSSFTNRKR